MKPTLFACLLLMSLASFATADSVAVVKKAKPQHHIFVNTTFFLKQIINLSNQNIAISPYIVGYKCFFNKSHGLRLSVGGNLSKRTEFPDSVSVRITKNNAVDYRVGYEYRHLFGKRWYLQTGVDMVGRYSISTTKANSTFDIVTTGNTSNQIGGGPFLGIQYNITDRIALFTETAFYYSYAWNKRKIESNVFPEQNVDRKTDTEYRGEFILPTSLYFVFMF